MWYYSFVFIRRWFTMPKKYRFSITIYIYSRYNVLAFRFWFLNSKKNWCEDFDSIVTLKLFLRQHIDECLGKNLIPWTRIKVTRWIFINQKRFIALLFYDGMSLYGYWVPMSKKKTVTAQFLFSLNYFNMSRNIVPVFNNIMLQRSERYTLKFSWYGWISVFLRKSTIT